MILSSNIIKCFPQLQKFIAEQRIDCFDFGCSAGKSLLFLAKLGYKGLGFDLSPEKLALADKAGLLCTNTNILEIPGERLVPFVSLFDMLEHLTSRAEAYVFIRKACSVASRHVVIKLPFFDADQLLFADGFKTYYSHWTGHKNHMTTSDFFYYLWDMKCKRLINNFIIGYRQPITSSDDKKIHSLNSPIDSLAFDKALHPSKKEKYYFPYKVYFETIIDIDISGHGYSKVFEKLSADYIAFNSKNVVEPLTLSEIIPFNRNERGASMHKSSDLRMQWFSRTFLQKTPIDTQTKIKVIDIGSYDVNGTYKHIFDPLIYEYTGFDMEKGPNVDIVPQYPYAWTEIAADSFDVVICGQVFEHLEFPWVTFAEMVRILKPGGMLCLIVPRTQGRHRYPVDTYRYDTDGLAALFKYGSLEILHLSTNLAPPDSSLEWYNKGIADCMGVAQKPENWKGFLNISQYIYTPLDVDAYKTGFLEQNHHPAHLAAEVAKLKDGAK